MSWFISKDNVNDALETSTKIIEPLTDDFVVKWKCENASNTGTVCSQNYQTSSSSRGFQIYYIAGELRFILGGATTSSGYTPTDRSGDWEIRFDGLTYKIIRNGTIVKTSTLSRGTFNDVGATWAWGCRHASGSSTYGYLWAVDIGNCSVEELDGTPIAAWDMDNADHGAGVVTVDDDVGSADLVGVNMATDGSAWVSDGGGLTASITESGPSFTEQISTTLSKAIEASITELGPSFAESINANLSANITGSIGESGPAFTESISATLSTLTIQGDITESGPSFTDSVSIDVQAAIGLNASITELGPSFTESVQASLDKAIKANISEYGPSFTDSIAISLTSEIDASIGEYGPSFIESLSAKIPVKISVNAKNTIKVKRSANTVKIKRKSNILRVK